MRDDDGGAALGGLVERPHDAVLGDRVQAGGGLVKHEDGRVLKDGPGYRHPLLLSAAELEAPLAHLSVVTPRPLQNTEQRSDQRLVLTIGHGERVMAW